MLSSRLFDVEFRGKANKQYLTLITLDGAVTAVELVEGISVVFLVRPKTGTLIGPFRLDGDLN